MILGFSNFLLATKGRKVSFAFLLLTSLIVVVIWRWAFTSMEVNVFSTYSKIKVDHPTSLPTKMNKSESINNETKKVVSQYPMTIEERMEYYLTPKWYSNFTTAMKNNNSLNINVSLFTIPIEKYSEKMDISKNILVSKIGLKHLQKIRKCCMSCVDILKLLMLPAMKECKYFTEDNRFLMEFGDDAHAMHPKNYPIIIPIFIKSRFVNEENAMLLKFRVERHFEFYSDVEKNDIPWEEKKNIVVWRGTMTGFHSEKYRYTIANKYFKYGEKKNNTNVSIDIAFSEKNQNYRNWKKMGFITDNLLRGGKPMKTSLKQLLTNKYLVIIPGNDVATNFNWILFSNSTPFVFRRSPEERKHEKETWAMHGLTLPYVHYIPFTLNNDDDDSLIKGYEFCESHPMNCSRIAQNGKQWMMQFRDIKREEEIQARMLSLYCNTVHIV